MTKRVIIIGGCSGRMGTLMVAALARASIPVEIQEQGNKIMGYGVTTPIFIDECPAIEACEAVSKITYGPRKGKKGKMKKDWEL